MEIVNDKPSYSSTNLNMIRTINSKANGIITLIGGNNVNSSKVWPTLDTVNEFTVIV